MQDNHEHEFDELFVNQAWAQMASMLDQEMPVAAAPRRPLLWLWLLAALILGGLAGGLSIYAWLHPARLASVPSRPIAASTAPASMAEACPEGAPAAYPAALAPRSDSAIPGEAAGLPLAALPARQGALQSAAQAVILALPAQEKLMESAAAPADPSADAPPTAEAAFAMPVLAALPIPIQLPEYTSMATVGVAQAAAARRSAFRLALEAGAFSSSFAALDGRLAGVSGQFTPLGKPYYLRLGLHYQMGQRQYYNGEQVIKHQQAPGEPSTLLPSSNLLSSVSHITQLQQLSAPLALGFRLRPRLALEAGLQLDWLLAAQAREEWYLLDGANQAGPGRQAGNNLLYRSPAEPARQQLASMAVGLQLGLAYRLSDRLSARLHYRHGLTDLLAAPAYQAYQRGGWAMLAYELGQW
jgi:hypothetical protein